MKLLIPPPVALAIIAAAMWGVDRMYDAGRITAGWRILAIALLVASAALMAAAVACMLRARTTIDPRRPSRTTHLVTDGVFRLSRNPIYLADVLLLAALAVWLGQPANAGALLAVFVWYIDRFQIRAEEQALRTLFGADYIAWCDRVRRWL